MKKQTIKSLSEEIDYLKRSKADDLHFHPVLSFLLITLLIIDIIIIFNLDYHPAPNIETCLDKIASNYCINHSMSFGKGHYGHYQLADDNYFGGYDFTCIDAQDKHIVSNNVKKFRFTMEEAKSCGYKQ